MAAFISSRTLSNERLSSSHRKLVSLDGDSPEALQYEAGCNVASVQLGCSLPNLTLTWRAPGWRKAEPFSM